MAFDTETTGLWAPFNRLVEVAGVKFRPGEDNVEEFQSLINPERPIPQEVVDIHGITGEQVVSAPTVAPVLERFLGFCGSDCILVAHNAPFDISFVSCELERVGLNAPENPILDTVDLYHRFQPGLPSYSLLSLSTYFEIAESQAHRALADAYLVRELFMRVVDRLGAVTDLSELEHQCSVYRFGRWPGMIEKLPPPYGDFNRALLEQLPVLITYRSAGKEPETRVIHPRQFFLLGDNLYVAAFCERAGADRTFRVDRIEAYTLLHEQEPGGPSRIVD